MVTKKYSIGTRIKYIGCCRNCKDKTGEVVEIGDWGCSIILPQSSCYAARNNKKLTCAWSDIIPLVQKNEQLLFEFMYND